ncbi:virion structural protein [Serratia phage BF]|uniref:Uncharacterized protein n=2 Tax=Eneladusvirus BF TaxID=2560751 RepID=A0A7L8ZNH0_9CAUD|nr:virion structural protein [Serratia phage BF]AQW88832.1 hypothetical protein BF_0307 [Serratia phage BF]QOI71788.1 hypothetical protein pEaSNUABM47_00304 [Erwinia phage pEa_SNUABM_47]QXO12001.1 hypothetical protein pEaSNUABM44_00305 [Erwinia phage pEa_SNUABM_44]QXO12554.1 hypothetical protein pEaSNUABM49_00308 [Erwinia phage pEa_SNUABM_49]
MFNRKEKLTILCRLLTIVACFVLGLFVLLNVNNIQVSAKKEVFPLIVNNVYNIKQQNVDNINIEFRKMIMNHPDITSAVLYKFVSDGSNSMYTGQINVTSETKDGTIIPNDNKTVSMVDSTNNVQEILLNNVHYDNIATIQLLCENKFDTSQMYSCEKYKKIGSKYKSVISIPIVQNIDVGVVGYVMITLSSEYDNLQVQNLVNGLRPYISSIQPLVK